MKWLSFFTGLITGWVLDRFVKCFLWRRKRVEPFAQGEMRADPSAPGSKVAHLEAQLAAVRAQLSAKEAEVQRLQASLVAAQGRAAASTSSDTADDLQKIEGIGPKIAGILNMHGIRTYADLAQSAVETLQQYLVEAGPRYRLAHPETWPEQARLAAAGQWEALETLQSSLKGGRTPAQ